MYTPEKIGNWLTNKEESSGLLSADIKNPDTGCSSFRMSYYGEQGKKGLFGMPPFSPRELWKTEALIIRLADDQGNELELFNSLLDGYDGELGLPLTYVCKEFSDEKPETIEKERAKCRELTDGIEEFVTFRCPKCGNDHFAVRVKLEYSVDESEVTCLRQEGKNVKGGDLFTWFWATVTCDKCNKQFKNLVEFETA